MLKKMLLCALLSYCASGFAFAQSEENTTPCLDQAEVRTVPPKYPARELRDGIGGVAQLRVTVDRCGKPLNIAVEKTSGNINLDIAAMNAARTWKFAGANKTGDVIVPINFVPPKLPAAGELPLETADGSVPLVYNDPAPGYLSGLGTQKGYVIDDRPIGIPNVKAAQAAIQQYCLLREGDLAPEAKSYATYGVTDFSEWWVFSEKHAVGPSVVRFRFFSMGDRGYMKTSYLCESEQEAGCGRLQSILENLPDQEMMPPPPPSPPPPVGFKGTDKEMLDCN